MTRPSTSSGTPSSERMPFSRRIGLRMSAWSTSVDRDRAGARRRRGRRSPADRDPDALLDLLLDPRAARAWSSLPLGVEQQERGRVGVAGSR